MSIPDTADGQNLVLLTGSTKVADRMNAQFYDRFPYPWQPMKFSYVEDPDFETLMLNQDIGDFTHRRIPPKASIWVAGCGTNQAVETALRCPRATVLGSDLSAAALERCERTARSLDVRNLRLALESINEVPYRDSFDYVICTGVVHHNADPAAPLSKLAAALKPTGVLELMVYNRYHRALPIACQKAVRVLNETRARRDLDEDLRVALALGRSLPPDTRMCRWLSALCDRPEAGIADLLLQPVEHGYTVESLASLADGCGLELLQPCISQLMRYSDLPVLWDIELRDAELCERYEKLPDVLRWYVVNLLLQEQSPPLWFYLQRRDAGCPRKTDHDLCEAFLETRWITAHTTQRSYVGVPGGAYELSPRRLPYPPPCSRAGLREIIERADGRTSMREVWTSLGWEPTRRRVTEARLNLTTSTGAYLRAPNKEPS